jgi:ATP-dependent helicase HrpA
MIASGSTLAGRRPRWVMAAELVETNRLWARRVATVKPEWAERAGEHLVKRSYGEPRWDADQGRALASETVTLYGLPVVSGRSVGYDRVDRAAARGMFIRHALVEGDWKGEYPFVDHNRRFVDRLSSMEARARRVDLVDQNALVEFYGARVAADVVSSRHFDRWWKDMTSSDPHLLDLDEKALRTATDIDLDGYPDRWRHGELVLPLTYRFDPGGPLDGVSVHVPLTALNQVTDDGFDWQVPGNREELVAHLARTLPKSIRRQLIPAAETIRAAYERLGQPTGRLVDALAAALTDVSGVRVRPTDFYEGRIPEYLRMNFVVTDAAGVVHDAGSDLDQIRSRLAGTTRAAIAADAPVRERTGIVSWDLDEVPRVVDVVQGRHVARAYPALVDDGESVSLRVLTDPDLQQRAMRAGVRRLLLLTSGLSPRAVQRGLDNTARLALASAGTSPEELVDDCITAAVDRVVSDHELPWDEAAFALLRREVRDRAAAIAVDAVGSASDTLVVAAVIRSRLASLRADSMRASVADAAAHLSRLVRGGFVVTTGTRRLPDVNRYVRGIEYRLDRLAGEVARDARRMEDVVPLERRYAAFVNRSGSGPFGAGVVDLGWRLEELRISVFAQPLGAKGGPSAAKIRRALDELGA